MATSNDIRKGLCIEFSNDIFKVIEFMHVKPGKGPAFVRTKLKSVTNGKVLDNTFSAGHKIDEVKVITRKFQYLYDDENGFHFMNNDDFSQLYLDKEMIENSQFMKPGEEVTIILKEADETPLSAELPQSVYRRRILPRKSKIKQNIGWKSEVDLRTSIFFMAAISAFRSRFFCQGFSPCKKRAPLKSGCKFRIYKDACDLTSNV